MKLIAEEIFSWFSKHQPDMTLEKITSQTERPGTVYLSSRILARGMYYIETNGEKYGYDLSIVVPSTPDDFWLPVVFYNDEKLYPALNRHILSNSQACLGTTLDIIKKCGIGKNFDFESFILKVSSTVRRVKTFALSTPFMGGTTALAPGESISLS